MTFRLKNFSLDRFNRDVNGSVPEDAYTRWSAYRREITAFMGKTLEGPQGSVIVFGAGGLNDVDLNYLCDRFGEVVLTDVDVQSVEAGIAQQGIGSEQKGKIEIIQCDYTGAAAFGLFEKLETLVQDAAPADAVADYIGEAFGTMRGGEELRGRRFDFVYSCPVYTQLVYTQIEVFLKILYEYGLYPYEDLNRILTAAHHHMVRLIGRYNDLLLSVLRDYGRIMVWTDIVEVAKGGDAEKTVGGLWENRDAGRLEEIVREDGLDFGMLGRDDLISKMDLTGTYYAVWPFNHKKEYLCQGLLGRNRPTGLHRDVKTCRIKP